MSAPHDDPASAQTNEVWADSDGGLLTPAPADRYGPGFWFAFAQSRPLHIDGLRERDRPVRRVITATGVYVGPPNLYREVDPMALPPAHLAIYEALSQNGLGGEVAQDYARDIAAHLESKGLRVVPRYAVNEAAVTTHLGLVEALPEPTRSLLATVERRYGECINAVVAGASYAHGSDADVNRWRGQAEAYRQIAEMIRDDWRLPAVQYQGRPWREANGVRCG